MHPIARREFGSRFDDPRLPERAVHPAPSTDGTYRSLGRIVVEVTA